MKNQRSINPLVVLIMAQAWCHVKRCHHGGLVNQDQHPLQENEMPLDTCAVSPRREAQERNAQEQDPKNLNHPEYELEPVVEWTNDEMSSTKELVIDLPNPPHLSLIAHALEHPLFQASSVPSLSLTELAKHWATPALTDTTISTTSRCWRLPDEDTAQALQESWGSAPPMAVLVTWDPAWQQALPAWVVTVINQCHAQGVQVWMEVLPLPHHWQALNEHVCRMAIQMGWSWWCTPPETVDAFGAYWEAYQPLWRFWFMDEQSDQWCWPWSDMMAKVVVDKFTSKTPPKYWIPDQRQKHAWSRMEDEVWRHFEKVMGGSGVTQTLILAMLSEIDKAYHATPSDPSA